MWSLATSAMAILGWSLACFSLGGGGGVLVGNSFALAMPAEPQTKTVSAVRCAHAWILGAAHALHARAHVCRVARADSELRVRLVQRTSSAL